MTLADVKLADVKLADAHGQVSGMSDTVDALGIDLGTTHSVVASAKSNADGSFCISVEPITQVIAAGTLDQLDQLPSFIYQADPKVIDEAACSLPWHQKPGYLVGAWARDLGAKTPSRLIHSAKSWLSHAQVDRKAPMLPFQSPDAVEQLSPYQATLIYLSHLQSAWDDAHPDAPMKSLPLVLTVPASFDPVARNLTAEAAHTLGLDVTLLEEPQAAFYAWIANTHHEWRSQLHVGDIVLVVDVGGGTTDLSLVEVQATESGEMNLERIAVGDHILLGGDNMDLALAYALSSQLVAGGQKKLQNWQILGLTQACRGAKEQLFANPNLEKSTLVVPSRGTKLIGGSLSVELTRELLNQVLLEGFLPQTRIDEKPLVQAETALAQLGLPYARDARISCHLSAFLQQQAPTVAAKHCVQTADVAFVRPTAILLNGGVFQAAAISERLVSVVNQWLEDADVSGARLLDGADLDLAVAKGAAYFAKVRQSGGVRIRGGLAQSYYLGIETAMPAVPGMAAPLQALCVAEFGMEEGASVSIKGHQFSLSIGVPVRFEFFSSNVRRHDQLGDLIEDWEEAELSPLPNIQMTLSPRAPFTQGDLVQVSIGVTITPVGTLTLEAIPESGEPWQVELDVRDNIR